MIAIGLSLLVIAAVNVFTIVAVLVISRTKRSRRGPRIFEPDLELVDRPDLIAKIPENEDMIPDANAGDWSPPPAFEERKVA